MSTGPVEGLGGGRQAVAASALGLVFGPSVLLIMCFGVFLPQYRTSFGWSPDRIAVGASIISLVVMLISPVQGALTDRLGARRLILLFLPLWAAGLAAMSLLPASLPVFYVACALLPVAGLGLWPLAYLRVPTTWFDRHLGLALGMTNIGPGVGAALVPLLLGALFATVGWRGAFLALAAMVLLVVWPILARWLHEGARADGPMGQAMEAPSLGSIARGRAFWVIAIQFLILGAVSTGLLVHQVAILGDAGVAPSRAIAMQSVVGLASIAGRVGTGWLLDRLRVQVVGAAIFAIAGLACLLLSLPSPGDTALWAAVAFGLVVGAEFDLLGMLIRRYQGVAAFGRTYGLVFSAFQLGGAIGAAAVGLSKARLGAYSPALHGLALALLAGAALFALIGPYRFPPEPKASRA